MRDVDEHLRVAARRGHRDLHALAEQVHVRQKAVDGRVAGEPPGPLFDVRGLSRRDERQRRHASNQQRVPRLLDRRLREVQADLRAVLLRLAGAVVVDLHDDLGFLREEHAGVFGEPRAELPRCPPAERADRGDIRPRRLHQHRKEPDPHRDRVARPAVRFVGHLLAILLRAFELAGRAGGVEVVERVVDDARVARLHFIRDDVLVFFQPGRQHEAAERVLPGRANVKIFRHLDDEVRFAESPAVGVLDRRRGVLWVAFGAARLLPRGQRVDVAERQRAGVGELGPADRLPRRHLLVLRVVNDVRCPRYGLLVSHERERPDIARPVATLAVLLDDRGHVAVIRDVVRGDLPLLRVDVAADGARGGRVYVLAGDECLDRGRQVVFGDLRVLLQATGVRVVDAPAVPQHQVVIEHERFRGDGGLERLRRDELAIREHRERVLELGGLLRDLGRVVVGRHERNEPDALLGISLM